MADKKAISSQTIICPLNAEGVVTVIVFEDGNTEVKCSRYTKLKSNIDSSISYRVFCDAYRKAGCLFAFY